MTGALLDDAALTSVLATLPDRAVRGRVVRITGIVVEATLPSVAIGSACRIERGADGDGVLAECVGFEGERALLVARDDLHGIRSGAHVDVLARGIEVPVGAGLLGRIVDASLAPLDGKPPPPRAVRCPLHAPPPPAFTRRRITRPLATGVRALDALLTFGEGQRVGVFAGAGVGKSVTLGMMAQNADADVIVVGLVGERGREVREFIERDLGPGLARSVVVVATGDRPPLERVHAALAATAVAEHFRAAGKRVLLLVDSLTRVAMALREIGLAAAEPPATKGYPPSVFSFLPRLVERAGNDAGNGSISALYTVLAEGDDLSDPVADCARAALDGHVVLSRKLAGGGHFPAVDVLQSVSRVMTDIAASDHQGLARRARDTLSALAESADLVDIGAYVGGSNPRVDAALLLREPLLSFLRQAPTERARFDDTLARLKAALTVPMAKGAR